MKFYLAYFYVSSKHHDIVNQENKSFLIKKLQFYFYEKICKIIEYDYFSFFANKFGIIIILLFTVPKSWIHDCLYSGIISRSNNDITLDQSIANIILPRFDVRSDMSDKSKLPPSISTTNELSLPQTGVRSTSWQSLSSFANPVGHDHLDQCSNIIVRFVFKSHARFSVILNLLQ